MKAFMSVVRKASTILAAVAMVVATTAVPCACHYWFAQPVEPEELRDLVNNK
jgi:cyclic lactone autoinducer peptide